MYFPKAYMVIKHEKDIAVKLIKQEKLDCYISISVSIGLSSAILAEVMFLKGFESYETLPVMLLFSSLYYL